MRMSGKAVHGFHAGLAAVLLWTGGARAQDPADLTSPSGGTISGSSSHASYPVTRVFDDNRSSYWLAYNTALPNIYVQYRFDTGGVVVNAYRLFAHTVGGIARAPKAFRFGGSFNGVDWVTLDTQTNQTAWGSSEGRLYPVWNVVPYTHYRLTISANNGDATYTGLTEMELYQAERDELLFIEGSPERYGTVAPPYGCTNGLAVDDSFACEAPADWVNVSSGLLAQCTGYALYTNGNHLAASGTAASLAYTHAGSARLVWYWQRRALLSVANGDHGSVTSYGGWVDEDDELVVTATPDAGYRFACWSGDVPADRRFAATLALLGGEPRSVTARFGIDYHVAAEGSDTTGDGLSWATAWRTVSTALAQASDYSRVLISNGTYSVSGLALDRPLTLEGVGPGETILDAGGSGGSKLVLLTCNHPEALVRNLTLYRGYMTSWTGSPRGCALMLYNGMVSNVTVRNSTGGREGDIVAVLGGCLTHSRVVNNTCDSSSGVSAVCQYGGEVRSCLLATNSVSLSVADVSGGVFTNNLICANTGSQAVTLGGSGLVVDGRIEDNGTLASTDGGMVRVSGGTLRNCLVTGNRALNEAGLRVSGGVVENCTVADNTISPVSHGKGAGLNLSSPGLVINSIFSGNARTSGFEVQRTVGTIIYSCADVLLDGEGNVAGDPGFEEAGVRNFTPSVASVCRDSGFDLPWMAGAVALAGGPRVVGHAADRGAFESRPLDERGLTCDFTADRDRGFGEELTVTLGAAAGGTNAAAATFAWDLDGDGEYDDATGATIVHDFGPGFHHVGLRAAAGTEIAIRVRENLVKLFPLEIYVSPYGSDQAPYLSWGTAARSAMDAVDLARTPGYQEPRIVTISNGIYAAQGIQIDELSTLQGEGSGETILDAGGSTGNMSLPVLLTCNHPEALVRNLTLYRGYGTSHTDSPRGCSIMLYNGMVSNVTVRGGFSGRGGEIVYVLGGLMTHCAVTNNSSDSYGATALGLSGGVIRSCLLANNNMFHTICEVPSGIMTNCLVRDNVTTHTYSASYYRNAMLLSGSGLATHCRFLGNGKLDVSHSGAVQVSGGTLRNCLIAGNRARDEAGLRVSGSGLAENCTVAENTISTAGDGKGAGLTISGGTVVNTIVSGNADAPGNEVDKTGGTVSYCCIDDEAIIEGEGNRTGTPGFTAAAAGDFTLKNTSRCLNAGTRRDWMTGAIDLAGQPRIRNRVPDIGAYEGLLPGGALIIIR